MINKFIKSKVFSLFTTFLKIGTFTFGGGYAMIPLIQKEVVEEKEWITNDDILDVIAIAESTPGPIAINAATFVGYKICGFFGALFATLGVVIPSFFIIVVVSLMLRQFQELEAVQFAFHGVRAGVLALIIKAFTSMYKQAPKNLLSYIIIISALVAVTLFEVNILLIIILCCLVGILSDLVAKKKVQK